MELGRVSKLESEIIGCSLTTHWWGINRKAGVEALNAVADSLGTNQKFLKIEKKIINHRNVHYRLLLETKNSVVQYWKNLTLPYVEPGTRLLRKDLIDRFEIQMSAFRRELQERVSDLARNYRSLKDEAATALQNLYREEDYPADIQSLFSFHWDYPNLNPPEYLLLYNPELYRRQQEAVRLKFEEAIDKAEKAFGGELQRMVSHLAERMQPNADGTRKKFNDSTVQDNFKEFFERFKTVSVTNSADLNAIVQKAEEIISGVNPEYLKKDGLARRELASQMEEVSKMLESKIGIAPRRTITRIEAPSASLSMAGVPA